MAMDKNELDELSESIGVQFHDTGSVDRNGHKVYQVTGRKSAVDAVLDEDPEALNNYMARTSNGAVHPAPSVDESLPDCPLDIIPIEDQNDKNFAILESSSGDEFGRIAYSDIGKVYRTGEPVTTENGKMIRTYSDDVDFQLRDGNTATAPAGSIVVHDTQGRVVGMFEE